MRSGPDELSGQANGKFPHGTACCLVLLHRLGVEAPQPIARGLDTSRAAWREEDFSVRACMRNRSLTWLRVAPRRCALAIGSAGAERPGEAAHAGTDCASLQPRH
jgi:hypothetical protein